MRDKTLLKLEKIEYPTARYAKSGENLRVLTRNEADYILPIGPLQPTAELLPIVVPTHRDVHKNRKNISRIMGLAESHTNHFILFLCSGKAKKEDIATIAKKHQSLHWIAIEEPFSYEHQYSSLETTYSPISYGGEKDISQKRNFGLQIARLMGWQTLFFMDDDITLGSSQLHKALDLIKNGGASVVGFSARSYPDNSVAVHADRWINGGIDSFIGAGALAVKTDSPFYILLSSCLQRRLAILACILPL